MSNLRSAKDANARRQTAKELSAPLGGALEIASVLREFLNSRIGTLLTAALLAAVAVAAVTAQTPHWDARASSADRGAGMATWTGNLEKNETLTIDGGSPSTGTFSGEGLPGVPVRLVIDQTNLGIAEMPNASNSYRRLVLKSHSKHTKIVIHWTVIQP